ncbi:uncharacterized protein LOC105790995 isoform X2 [Gossypium raimondii]|uniref:uncharacterized protein LOC105790995 isoform X2 n=1 Tax=Gossypium raimondii TaxID=29730 RepID=UPI00227A8CB9|nr:uncharacterized protein LOC105790995 isoform X2 [Gossypium raimondii]
MSKEKQQKIGIELSSSPFRWLYHYISKHQRRIVILSVDLGYALVDNPLPLYQPEFIGVQASSIQYLGMSYRLPSVAKACATSLALRDTYQNSILSNMQNLSFISFTRLLIFDLSSSTTFTLLMTVKASLSTKTFLKPNSSVKVTTCRHDCASTMVEFNTCSFGNFWALQILLQIAFCGIGRLDQLEDHYNNPFSVVSKIVLVLDVLSVIEVLHLLRIIHISCEQHRVANILTHNFCEHYKDGYSYM